MSIRSEVLLWAQRIVGKRGVLPHQLLEIKIDAGLEEAQEAFHRIARTAHPDLHRGSLTPEELELVTTAYARIAAAYQDLRSARMQTGRMRPLKPDPPPPRALAHRPPSEPGVDPAGAAGSPGAAGSGGAGGDAALGPAPATRAGSGSIPVAGLGAPAPAGTGAAAAAGAMSPKALLYYRKAELCLRRGDLRGAVLQLKMAIASDPSSAFLRTALAEVEAALK